MKRPLLWVALSLAVGAWGAQHLSPGCLFPVAVLLGGTGCLLWPHRTPRWDSAGTALLFTALGILYWQAWHSGEEGDPISRYARAHPQQAATLEGRVLNAKLWYPAGGDTAYLSAVLQVENLEIDGEQQPVHGKVLLKWSQANHPLHPGEVIRCTGRLDPVLGYVNHGVRDTEQFYRGRGVYSAIQVSKQEVDKIDTARLHLRYWTSRFRHWEAMALSKAVPETSLPLVFTVWLGASEFLAPEVREIFLNSGTAHILAVSGVHTGIVFMSVGFLLRLLFGKGRKTTLLILLSVFLFAFVAGARISSLRAAVMVTLYLSADILERDPDAPTALSLSGILFFIVQPDCIFETGFLLSFLSIGSILLFVGHFERLLSWLPRGIRGSVSVAFSVQLLTFPLSMHFFHVAPLLAIPANLLMVPLLTAMLWLSCITTLLAMIFPIGATLFGNTLNFIVQGAEHWARWVDSVPGCHPLITSPTPLALLCYAIATVFFYRLIALQQHRKMNGFVLAVTIVMTAVFWTPRPHAAIVDFLDVGHADAVLIRTATGENILIDGGDKSSYNDGGAQIAIPFLLGNHVRQLDYVIATHADRDHMGGLLSVLETLDIGCAIVPLNPSGSALEAEFLAICEARAIPVQRAQAGDALELGSQQLEFLHPSPTWQSDEDNNNSLIFRMNLGEDAILFTGDIEAEGELVASKQACQARLLKIPHHGSATSSTPRLLDAVSPEYAVLSSRAKGRWKAFDPGVEERYRQRGIILLRTDHHGGIRLRLNGDTWEFSGARLERGYSLEK